MASGFEFEIEGLEELERDLMSAIQKCPAQAEETLLEIAKDFKKSAKQKANSDLKTHERVADQKKKSIKRKWGHKLVDHNKGATVLVWNSARHFHLVEDGHNIVRGNQVIGFVPGKHIMEKTRNDYQEIIPERFRQMIDDILRGSDLD